MLLRAALGRSACPSCQSLDKIRPRAVLHVPGQYLAPSRRLFHGDEGSRHGEDVDSKPRVDKDKARSPIIELESIASSESRPIVARQRHAHGPWSSSGRRPAPFSARGLGIESLGQPANVLVMHDDSSRPRRQIPMVEAEEGTPSDIDVDGLVNTQVAPATAEEAHANIEELRPHDTTILPRSEFRTLVMKLHDGFTVGQLRDYAARFPKVPLPRTARPARYDWVSHRQPWTPSTTQDGSPFEHETRKTKLAWNVVRNCWKLEIQEVVDSIGSMAVKVRPKAASILRGLQDHWIRDVDELTAGRGLVAWSANQRKANGHLDHELRIHATRVGVETILKSMDDFLKAVESRTVSLPAGGLSQAILDEVSRLTRTSLALRTGELSAEVRWCPDPDRPPQVEDPSEVVARLLAAAVRPDSPHMSRTLTVRETEMQDSIRSGGLYFVEEDKMDKSQRPWNDRLSTFARWVAPTPRQHTPRISSEKRAPSILPSVLKWPSNSIQPATEEGENIVQDPASSSATAEWLPRVLTTATFGHVLHDRSSNDATPEAARRRLLSPRVPQPPSLIFLQPAAPLSPAIPPPSSDSELPKPHLPSTTLVLHFVPSTRLPFPALGHRPLQLHLRLPSGDASGRISWDFCADRELRWPISGNEADVLFPHEAVDVRISQQRALVTSADHQQPDLKRFIDASELNLAEGRLLTPPRVNIRLNAASAEALARDDGKELSFDGVPEDLDIEFLFGGIEVHRVLEGLIDSTAYRMRYTSIEGGLSGGHRAELSLLPDVQRATINGATNDDYLRLVHDIVVGNLFPWR